jgi:hypothetical protein
MTFNRRLEERGGLTPPILPKCRARFAEATGTKLAQTSAEDFQREVRDTFDIVSGIDPTVEEIRLAREMGLVDVAEAVEPDPDGLTTVSEANRKAVWDPEGAADGARPISQPDIIVYIEPAT